MFRRAALLLALLAAPAQAADSQWMLTQQRVGQTLRPVAVFLDWNHGSVLFRISCEADSAVLVVRHYVDGREVKLRGHEQMALVRGAATLPLQTVPASRGLEGRIALTPSVLATLSAPGEMQIDAPNALLEPWHVGRAEPLVRIAELCLASKP